uniref:carbonic anhydrase n=1 Tax=viral metagenome TaxID=1070528 RepID=A0A6C0B472_9ZZZZ
MSKCAKGTRQSPINIDTSNVTNCGATCDLLFYYRSSTINLANIGNNIIFTYDNGSYIVYNNEVYELEKISFFTASAHKIDGDNYPIEMNLYHRSPNTGRIAIISIMCIINGAASKSHSTLEVFSAAFPKLGRKQTTTTSSDWNIFEALPEIKSFYSYEGSLPREPCDEGVTWIVFENSINCSATFHNNLEALIKNNTRDVQNLNTRTIYYNANTAKKNNRNYGSNFRCYTEKEFNKACSCLNTQTDVIKYKNRLALMGIILAILVIIILLIVLYLRDQGAFEGITAKLGGIGGGSGAEDAAVAASSGMGMTYRARS